MCAAHALHSRAELRIFEAASRPGGHTNTVTVEHDGESLGIDTGFIVFNDRNYPEFCKLMAELDVPSQESEMSFSFSCEESGLEYNGESLDTLFAQRRNLFRPSFYRMLAGILRFNRHADRLVDAPDDLTLGEFLDGHGFSGAVVEDYLLPMAGAIWSSEPSSIREYPAHRFGKFFVNHGLMQLSDRPQWRTIRGGSIEYLKKLSRPFADRILTDCPVEWIARDGAGVTLKAAGREPELFDQVVLACHSDQALALLKDPSPEEKDILSAIPYRPNRAVLHTDTSLLPRSRRAWAAWNYFRPAGGSERVSLSYNLTTLQRLPTETQFLVTLNDTGRIDEDKILAEMDYEHPFYTVGGIRAQQRWQEINGHRNTWYCGAWWGNGFHEDGVVSARRVCEQLLNRQEHEELHLPRAG